MMSVGIKVIYRGGERGEAEAESGKANSLVQTRKSHMNKFGNNRLY